MLDAEYCILNLCTRALDHSHIRLRRDELRQPEARRIQECSRLGLGALAPAGHDHHVKVRHDQRLDVDRMFHQIGKNPLDEEEFSFFSHRSVAVLEERDGTAIVKAINDS